MSNTIIPTDLYQNIKEDKVLLITPFVESLDYTTSNIELLTKLFMYAVSQKSLECSQLLAEYGADVNGWGDYAKYYNMRRRVPGVEDIIYGQTTNPTTTNC